MTAPEERPVLLRVVVGSQAHGTAHDGSDYDYREVFYVPTGEMLSLGRGRLKFAWQTDSKFTDDEGGYEIAEFLHLVSKGAPNVVEMLFAPMDGGGDGDVQRIGRLALSRESVQSGIIGYAMNSFRKIPERPGKWKGGMLRALYQGRDLIQTGRMSLAVPETGWGELVRAALRDELSDGAALDRANVLIAEIKGSIGALPDAPDWDAVNAWLLDLRREHWEA